MDDDLDDDNLPDADLPDGGARGEIVRLEARIDELAGTVENCRKFMMASRIAIAAGAVLLVALMFGMIAFSPAAMVAGFAAVIGGVVLLGSNRSTSEQAGAALQAAEAHRAALIGQIDLRVVSGGNGRWAAPDALRPPTLH